MKYESAEFTKISINVLLASSIITANILAEACNKISADWYEIMPALKLDGRIGEKAYIKPGLGISGGNIERDISTIQKILIKNKKKPLINKPMEPGTHRIQWNPVNLSSGLYIVQLEAGEKTFNQKITFIK